MALAQDLFDANVRASWADDPATAEALIRALDDPEPEVAERAVVILAEIARVHVRDMRALPGVLRLLRSEHAMTRAAAVRAAGALQREEACEVILPLLRDPSPQVRGTVLLVLTLIAMRRELSATARERLVAPLVEALEDLDAQVRARAASALRHLGDRSALRALRQALGRERVTYVRESIEMAFRLLERGS